MTELETKKLIGKRIANALERKGIKQKALANRLGYYGNQENTVSLWISGKRCPSIEQLKEIAIECDTTVDYLVGNADYLKPYDNNILLEAIEIKTICESSTLSNDIEKICNSIENNDELYLNYKKAYNDSVKTYEKVKELQDYLKEKYGNYTLDMLEKSDLKKITEISKPYIDCVDKQKDAYNKMISS